MKIIFMGTPRIAVASAEALRTSAHELIAVVTVPDKPTGRGLQVKESAVKVWAREHNLTVLQPASLKSPEFLNEIRSLKSDLFVVVAFRILPRELYTIPPSGAFNLHASLLPKYRGAAPINWAIINGERETGVTTFFLQDKVDTGAMILQEHLVIGDDETAGDVHDRLAVLGAAAVVRSVDCIAAGTALSIAQEEFLATPAPKLTTELCRIAWNRPAQTIHNFVRGLAPTPGAWTMLNDKSLKIFGTRLTDEIPEPAYPGECIVEKGRLFVKTEDVLIELTEVQLQGRSKTGGPQFVQGRGVRSGLVLQ